MESIKTDGRTTRTCAAGLLAAIILFIFQGTGRSAETTTPTLPAQAALPHSAGSLAIDPTTAELAACRVFAVRLVPIPGLPPQPGENAALSTALKQYAKRIEPDDLSSITGFLQQYPSSTWRVSLLTNLGSNYYHTGYFDKAMDAWEAAWNAGKTSTDPALSAVAEWALSQFAKMNARLGRFDRLTALFAEVKGHRIKGPGGQFFLGAKEGYLLMKSHPERAFRCGPIAVDTVLAFEHSPKASSPLIDKCLSTTKGISLATLKTLTDSLGVNFQLAKRSPGAQIIVPSIVHWKVNHYGALLVKTGHRLLLEDPTFGENLSITTKALDEEASGYFLVPPGKLPPGWQGVSMQEAASVWGRGAVDGCDPFPTNCSDDQTGGDGAPCSGCMYGMPTYDFHTMLTSLHIVDTPLPFKPPYGLPIDLSITYTQRGVLPPDIPGAVNNYANVGPQWTMNLVSYISDDPSTDHEFELEGSGTTYVEVPIPCEVYLYTKGGGVRPYYSIPNGNPFNSFYPQASDQSNLTQTSGTSYELDYSDGSKDFFGTATATTGGGRMVFLTKSTDRAGNSQSITYNSDYQLTTIQGAAGTSLNFTYNAADSITSVTDSNTISSGTSRQVTFSYNSSGQLASVTDAVGMTSSFTYSPGTNFINSMTTPYGTTTFSEGDSTDDLSSADSVRWLQATDPLGASERLEFWGADSPISDSDPDNTLPSGISIENEFLSDRNSFYWSKKAFMDAPGDYSQAQLTHWLHTADPDGAPGPDASGVVESKKNALENRVWYAYPGQTSPIATGSTDLPMAMARVLVDSSTATQLYLYQYNAAGNRTQVIDPLGRTTTYVYDTNNIDVLGVYQSGTASMTGTDHIAAYSYNSQHQVVSGTDAAGQTTTYTYNTQGQIASRAVKRSGTTETTNWTYDGNGFLTSVTGPFTGATTSFTYNSQDLVETSTDSEGYGLTYSYDALNRPTLVTYPDSTTEQTIYNRRDVEWKKDRMNRWTHYLHDQLGRLTYVVDPAGHNTQYQYCPCGALTGIVDGMGNTTAFTQDVQSRMTQKIFADGSTITYTYQPTSSLLQSGSDAKGQVTTYSYNIDNTLAGVSYSGTSTPSVAYTYDSMYPRISTMSESVTGTTTYNYNASSITGTLGGGKLSSIVNNGSCPYTLTYGYDSLGHVVSRAIDGGTNTETTVYDGLGRVTQVTNALGTFGYTPYNATNLIASISYPNGQAVNYSYYTSGVSNERLQTITNQGPGSSGTISKFTYGYSPAGDITSWSQQADSNTPAGYAYGYDGTDELLSAVKTSSTGGAALDTYAYRYDAAGNRLGQQTAVSGTTFVTSSVYNDLNQVTNVSGTSGLLLAISGSLNEPGTVALAGTNNVVSTDTNNDFTIVAPVVAGSNAIPIIATATGTSGAHTTGTLGFNVAGGASMSPMTYDANGNFTTSGTVNYVWDTANRLVKIWYGTVGSSASTTMNYDGLGRRVQIIETSSSGSVTSTKNLVWDGMSICEEKNASGSVTKRYFNQGVQISGSDYYYTRDHLGSIREVTGTNGVVLARYDYDPYGQQTQLSGTMSVDFGYTGLYYHQPSGLLLAPYREYSASLGRWISRDPLRNAEFKQGPNLYEYCGDDPINGIDPLGLWKVYGNYCGPDWTGGRVEPYTPHPAGYYAAPIDALDSACRDHDICYYNCRQKFPCDKEKRKACMQSCNNTLYSAAGAIGGFWGHVIQGGMIPPPDAGPDDPDCGKNCKKPGTAPIVD
jgi:RHS repeat-associated protein